MSTRKATRRPKAHRARKPPSLTTGVNPTPIFDLTEGWLSDLGLRSTQVATALFALRDYPFRSPEVGAYGVEPLESVGNKLIMIGQAALKCAAEIRAEIQKPKEAQS